MEKEFRCPYCFEPNTILIELENSSSQKITSDCEVCCNPIIINVFYSKDDEIEINVERELE